MVNVYMNKCTFPLKAVVTLKAVLVKQISIFKMYSFLTQIQDA